MKRLIPLTFFIALTAMATISMANETPEIATDTSAATTPTEVKYTPKFGSVTFNHTNHQARADCATCHHTGVNSQCKSCHGVEENIPTAKKAFHNQCKGCHIEREQGPKGCKECHVK